MFYFIIFQRIKPNQLTFVRTHNSGYYAPVHGGYLLFVESLEIGLGDAYRGVPHGIGYQFLPVLLEVGDGGPAVARAVGADAYVGIQVQRVGQLLQAVVEDAQRALVLRILVAARLFDKGEKERCLAVARGVAADKGHGLGFHHHGDACARLAAAVSDDVVYQVAAAQEDEVDKRYAAQQEEQGKDGTRKLERGRQPAAALQDGTPHLGRDGALDGRLDTGVDGAEHAHVGGDAVPAELEVQHVFLELLEEAGVHLGKRNRAVAAKKLQLLERTRVNMGCAVASLLAQCGYEAFHELNDCSRFHCLMF